MHGYNCVNSYIYADIYAGTVKPYIELGLIYMNVELLYERRVVSKIENILIVLSYPPMFRWRSFILSKF